MPGVLEGQASSSLFPSASHARILLWMLLGLSLHTPEKLLLEALKRGCQEFQEGTWTGTCKCRKPGGGADIARGQVGTSSRLSGLHLLVLS